MSRLVSFLSALWLSTVAAHPGFGDLVSGVKNGVTNEVQAGLDPLGKTVAFIGGAACSSVKPMLGVSYAHYENNEPDMSKLTLVYMTTGKTVIYDLQQAGSLLPKEPWFQPTCRLLVYMHGFTDNPQKASFQTIRQAVEAGLDDCVTILALDASSLIKWFYLRASTIVTFIGRVLGETLAALISAGVHPSKIHLIGHSLGSHIAGSAGKEVFGRTGFKVGRISGLDPAGPCFGDVDKALRLFKGDAVFVDVIHSDAGVYGMPGIIGDVDFFPNSGSEQPGCLLQTCSHSRAWEYFAESALFPGAFIGIKCDDYYEFRHSRCNTTDTSIMGYFTPTNTTGKYYLQTAGESPFGAGVEGITYKPNGIVRGIKYGFKDIILG
ncbi:hypothetical protein PYW08_009007 [Mythimna loreyi]|uniref:Uncharacterized protein n=1 Tax=Mythimna loreyi TaxID=667449 RepID=A0ACC2Q7X0_9NEOP|nr:hypothetical protein PYW08_009007 [Mythimna loreyi]